MPNKMKRMSNEVLKNSPMKKTKKHQNAGIFGLMNKKTKEGQKASVEDEPSSTNFWAQQGNSKSQPNKKVVGRVPKSDVDEFFRAVEENNLSSVKKLLHQHKGKLLNRKKDESEDESDEHSFWNPLEIAADMGYKEMVEHFLQQEGIEVNQQDASEWTPLLCTAERGHTEIATLLLEKGADPNIPNNDGDTPLMMAAEYGHLDMVQLLVKNDKTNKSLENHNGDTPLISAAKGGCPKCVKELLEFSDVNASNKDKETALMHACHQNVESVNLILGRDEVKIDMKDKDDDAAIHWAMYGGSVDMVKLLLKHNAEYWVANKSDQTPLIRASLFGEKESLEVLLNSKFCNLPNDHLFCEDSDGRTALMHAASEGHESCLELILKHPAFAGGSEKAEEDCRKALELSREMGNEDCAQALSSRLKIDAQERVFKCAMYGSEDGLEDALKDGFVEVNKILVNKEDKSGRPPLYYAVKLGHEGVVRILLEKKADPTWKSKDDNATLLHHAAKGGHASIIKMLLEKGVKTTIRCKESFMEDKQAHRRNQAKEEKRSKDSGMLALDLAILEGHEGCVRMLLNRNGYHTTDGQKSPEYLAAEKGKKGILALILDHIEMTKDQCTFTKRSKDDNVDKSEQRNPVNNEESNWEVQYRKRGILISKNKTPLHAAAENNHVGCVKLLLDRKMDTNKLSGDSRSPLSTACEKGYDEVVALLLATQHEHQKPTNDIYSDENHPLFLATKKGHAKCVELLLEQSDTIQVDCLDPEKRQAREASPYGDLSARTGKNSPIPSNEYNDMNIADPVSKWYAQNEDGWKNKEQKEKLMQLLLKADHVSWEAKRTWLDSCVDGDDPKIYKAVVDILSRKTTQRRTLFLLMMDFYMYMLWISSFVILAFGEIDGGFHDALEAFATAGTFLAISYFTTRELLELCKQDGFSGYFQDVYNCVDTLAIVMSAWNLILVLQGTKLNLGEDDENKQYERVLICCGVFLCLSFVGYLRSTFLSFAIFVGGVSKIIFDLLPFGIITLIILIVFSFVYYIQDNSAYGNFGDAILSIFYQFVSGPEERTKTAADVLFAIISVIILLNVVIAIVSSSWEAAESQSFVLLCKNRLELLNQVDAFFDIFKWLDFSADDDTTIDDYSSTGSLGREKDYCEKIKQSIELSSSGSKDPFGFVYKHAIYPVCHLVLLILPWFLGAVTFGQLWPKSMRHAMFSIIPEESDTSNEEVVNEIQEFKRGFMNSEDSMMREMKNEMKIMKENNRVLHGTVQNLNTTVQDLAAMNQKIFKLLNDQQQGNESDDDTDAVEDNDEEEDH